MHKEGFQQNSYIGYKGITNICSPADADYNSPECVNIKYIDYDNKLQQGKAILDPGYGVDTETGFVKYVGGLPTRGPRHTNAAGSEFERHYTNGPDAPNGYMKNPIPTLGTFKNDKGNIDIQFHEDPSKLENAKDDLIGYALTKDKNGNVVPIAYSDLRGQTIYDQPGTSRFGPSSYVPNYEETVFLSKLTNEIPFVPIPKQESGSVGFCKQNATTASLNAVEQKCGTLDNETCASTECCVLFGGAKCVAGNETGPSVQANYSDVLVKNRDYYYYKGKCYGNCSQSYGIKKTTGYNNTIYATYSPALKNATHAPPNTPNAPWDGWKNWNNPWANTSDQKPTVTPTAAAHNWHEEKYTGPTISVPTDTGSVPTYTGSVPTDTGSVPTDTGSVPTYTGSVPTYTP